MVAHQRATRIKRKVRANLGVFGRCHDGGYVGNAAVRCGDGAERPHFDAVRRGRVACRFTLQELADDVHAAISSSKTIPALGAIHENKWRATTDDDENYIYAIAL